MDKLEDVVNAYRNVQRDSQEKKDRTREETINQLLILRKRAIRLVNNASKTLGKREAELKTINETICEVQGHTYTDWEMHDGFLDRTWYYTRNCQLCGKKERVEEEPVDYKKQILKKRKK